MPAQVPNNPSLRRRKVDEDDSSSETKEEKPVYTDEQKQAVDRLIYFQSYSEKI